MKNNKIFTVDAYVSTYTKETRLVLNVIRKIIKEAVPGVKEQLLNGIPTFTYNGEDLVHFTANDSQVEFFATPNANCAFNEELKHFKQVEGFVYFPLSKPMPYHLISRIVKFNYNSCFKISAPKTSTFSEITF